MVNKAKSYIKKHIVLLHIIMPILILSDLVFLIMPLFNKLQITSNLYVFGSCIGILGIFILDNYFKQVYIIIRHISNQTNVNDEDYNDYKRIINKSSYNVFVLYLFISAIAESILAFAIILNYIFTNIFITVVGLAMIIMNGLVVGNAMNAIHSTDYNCKEIERRYNNGNAYKKI